MQIEEEVVRLCRSVNINGENMHLVDGLCACRPLRAVRLDHVGPRVADVGRVAAVKPRPKLAKQWGEKQCECPVTSGTRGVAVVVQHPD